MQDGQVVSDHFQSRPNIDVLDLRFGSPVQDLDFMKVLAVDLSSHVRRESIPRVRILDEMAAYPIMFTQQLFMRSQDVDYGHKLKSTMALYPQFTEKTRLKRLSAP